MRRRHGEQEGQAVAVLLLLVLALFAAGLALLGLGEASDVRGKAQKSADAGALAAAVEARNVLVRLMLSPAGASFSTWSAWSGYAQAGCARAPGYVSANSSSVLTGCSYRPAGQVRVDTRSAPGGNRGLTGTATATADINAPTCVSVYTYTYTTVLRTITCTGTLGSAAVTFDMESQQIVHAAPEQAWRRTFRVRLVN